MDAVLLAGGFGTRLRPLTYTRPKPLLPVAGRPMLDHVLDRLPDEVDHVVVAVNWLADALRDHVEGRRGVRITVVEEPHPLGTAGAVKHAARHLTSDRLFVLNADIISDMDLTHQLHTHLALGAVGSIAIREVPAADVVDFGVVDPDPASPPGAVRIRGFVEKPKRPEDAPSRFINAGAYLLERGVLELIPDGRLVSMEKEIFPRILDKGFFGVPFEGAWIDVGDPTRLRQATHHLDPAYRLGPGSTYGDGATMRASVGGRRVLLGADAQVTRCVLGDDVQVAPGAQLVDCVVGDGEQVAGKHSGSRIWSRPVPAGYPASQVGNEKSA